MLNKDEFVIFNLTKVEKMVKVNERGLVCTEHNIRNFKTRY